jgi:NodT family efflux transporter outer membrane factor (OMF) lipoprotein
MKRLLAIAVTGTMLGGCISSPSTIPRATQLKAETLGLGQAAAPQIADNWWKAFGDPQLDTLVDKALQGSPTLAAALARVRLAQSQLASSRAATYPQATLDAQETRLRFSKNYEIPPPYAGTTQWVGTAAANLSWSLDLFGKEQALIDKLRASAEAEALDATAARLMLAGTVTEAYIQLSRAYRLADVAEEAARQREGVFKLTKLRVDSGLESPAAQKQAEALLAVAREDLTRAVANREIAAHQIAALIGRGADSYDIARPKLNPEAIALPQTLPADLLARRADIAAAKARVDAEVSGREAAHQAFYPDIDLLGTAGWAALGLSPMFSGSALQYGAGPAIDLPIFDAGKRRADYAGATARLDEAVADYNQTIVVAVKQTADALTELRTIQDQTNDQRQALAAAEESFRMAQERYRSGLSPQLNVLSAEDLVIQARRQSAALDADIAAARVSLLMAIGGGFDAAQTYSSRQTSENQGPNNE